MTTNLKKKRLLSLYADNQREIQRLDAELVAWQKRYSALCEAPAADLRNIPDSYYDLKGAHEALAEIRALLLGRLRDATRQRIAAERCIQSVDDLKLRTLLTYRYIDGLTWEETSEAMGYDVRWIFRLHDKALTLAQCPTD